MSLHLVGARSSPSWARPVIVGGFVRLTIASPKGIDHGGDPVQTGDWLINLAGGPDAPRALRWSALRTPDSLNVLWVTSRATDHAAQDPLRAGPRPHLEIAPHDAMGDHVSPACLLFPGPLPEGGARGSRCSGRRPAARSASSRRRGCGRTPPSRPAPARRRAARRPRPWARSRTARAETTAAASCRRALRARSAAVRTVSRRACRNATAAIVAICTDPELWAVRRGRTTTAALRSCGSRCRSPAYRNRRGIVQPGGAKKSSVMPPGSGKLTPQQ